MNARGKEEKYNFIEQYKMKVIIPFFPASYCPEVATVKSYTIDILVPVLFIFFFSFVLLLIVYGAFQYMGNLTTSNPPVLSSCPTPPSSVVNYCSHLLICFPASTFTCCSSQQTGWPFENIRQILSFTCC